MYALHDKLNDIKRNKLVGTDKEKCDQIAEWIYDALIYLARDTCTINVAIDIVIIKFDNHEDITFKFDIEKVEKIHIMGAILMAMIEL